MVTTFPRFVGLVTPKDVTGWGGRLLLLLGVISVLTALVYPAIYGGTRAPFSAHFISTVVFGVPLAGGALWILALVGHEHQRLKRMTEMDPVTALANRQTFVQRMRRVQCQSGMLLLLDIDHFKSINDRRGRHGGDLCLMALAQRFREVTRDTDIVGRLDGASFAIYLPGATAEMAHDVADRLSQGILIATDSGVTRVTTSVGAVFADGQTSLDRLLLDAEWALDRAKLQGRARVVLDTLPLVA